MFVIFIISKDVSIKEQNFAVPAASGSLYFNKTLLTVELIAFAARLALVLV